ncbi:MAG TPA: hypothetical protein VGN72_01505 [Tepidisphaeraceae bacterium]|jgi:hypothetical protein|nr:hypothetical protein [Tepidisphaeraceae bacterium]
METTVESSYPPLSARSAIARLRRDLALGAALKAVLGTVLIVAMLFGDDAVRTAAFFAVGAAWVALTLGSRRGTALAAGSSSLIAAGMYDAAEVQLSQALRGFSLFRSTKLLGLHHLALLRHAQRRWDESADLSRALLGHRLGPLKGLARSAQLMLAGASVNVGDLPTAYRTLSQLYAERLSLGESLHLLRTQTEYEARIGAWPSLMQNIPVKVQLAELMPANDAAMVQALWALAARKTGQNEWEQWLCSRAALVGDVQEMTARQPMLRELWA